MPFNSDPLPSPDSTEQVDTEAGVRRALGLDGPQQAGERPAQQQAFRPSGGFSSGGFSSDRPKRRFVQDGEVPVVIVHGRRDQGGQTIEPRGTHGAPPTNRLEVAERALRAEHEARETAERALAEVQAHNRDLQTKIGHAALARDEHRSAMLRAEAERAAAEAALVDERGARERAEEARALAEEALVRAEEARGRAEDARAQAEAALVQAIASAVEVVAAPVIDLFEDVAPVVKRKRGRPPRQAVEAPIPAPVKSVVQAVLDIPDTSAPAKKAKRGRAAPMKIDAAVAAAPTRKSKAARAPEATATEPKPVRWWIKPKKPAGRRGTAKGD